MVTIAKLPSWHFTFFRLTWRSEKSWKSFLQNFANGDHCETAIMTLHFLSSYLAFRKKSKFIFAKFREWWPLRNCHHDTSLSFILLGVQKKSKLIFAKFREWWPSRNCHHDTSLSFVFGVQKKVEIHFCKISRIMTIAKLPSWHRTSYRHSWRLKKSRNSFLQIFANGSHHGLAIITTRLFCLIWRLKLKKKFNFIFEKFCVAITNWPSLQLASFVWLGEI